MGGPTFRNEYYLEDGELVRRRASRPTGYGPWRFAGDRSNLVVAIEMNEEGITRVIPGNRHSRELEAEAVHREYGFKANRNTPDIGPRLPILVAEKIRREVSSAVDGVSARYRSLSNEERMTGALFGRLPEHIEVSGWSVRFRSQGYSSVGEDAKEGRVGADAGVVIELVDGPDSVVKGVWLQAKRTSVYPNNILALPDLSAQMRKMRDYTRDGYALIFTPESAFVSNGDVRWSFADWLVEAVQCKRGDRNPELIADTFDRHHVLDMTVAHLRGRLHDRM
jgi:hypothetical protein